MNTRQKKLVDLLLANQRKYEVIDYYRKKLLCSEKTIRNDLKIIQEFIKRHHIKAALDKVPGRGVRLIIEDEEDEHLAYLLDIYRLQIDSRYSLFHDAFYILLFRNKPIPIPELAELTYSNSTTLKHEIKHWETLLNNFSITLDKHKGIKVIGDEKKIRLFALYYFFGFSNNAFSYEFTRSSQAQIDHIHQSFVTQLSIKLNISFTSNAFLHFAMYLKIMTERLKLKYPIQDCNQIPLAEYQRENFHLIQDLFSSHYKICIPETECLFLLDLIEISTKQKSIEEIQNFAPSKTVKKAVEVFIQQIQQIINYSFDPLTIKALEAEFDLAIIRSKKEIRVINTLYNDIIQKDPFLFGTVSFLFNSTPELSIFNFNRMDICRFVMIIKNNIDQYFLEYPQITAVLISNTGMDQLFYTKKTIEKYLPFIKIEHFLSPEQLENSKLAIDIIISFEYLNNPCYPIVYVDYLLTYDKLMSLKSKIQDIVFTRKTLKETTYSSIRLSKRKNYYLDDLKNVLLTYFSDKKYDFNRETMKKVISNSSFVVEDCLYLITFFPDISQLEKITFHLKKELIIGMNQVFKVVLFIADLNEIHQFYGRPAILLDIK